MKTASQIPNAARAVERAVESVSPTARYHVPNLERALTIIEHLARETAGAGISELATRLSLPKNSVFRILMTLHAHHWVQRDEATKEFRLGRKLLALGYAAVGERNLVEVALDAMRALRDETKETVLVGTLVGDEGVVLEQCPSPLPIKFLVEVGTRFQIHTAAPGKAIVAFLPADQRDAMVRRLSYPRYNARTITSARAMQVALDEVRRTGFAVDRAEHIDGLHCVAAPILDRHGRPIAAIWATGPSSRLTEASFPQVARLVIAKAQHISQQMGHHVL